jgi:hypothetical protein
MCSVPRIDITKADSYLTTGINVKRRNGRPRSINNKLTRSRIRSPVWLSREFGVRFEIDAVVFRRWDDVDKMKTNIATVLKVSSIVHLRGLIVTDLKIWFTSVKVINELYSQRD